MDGNGANTETIEGLTLRELSGLGLELCRDLQQRALAAEDNHEAAHLAESFAKVGRGVRQTIALKMKLVRDEQAFFRDFKPFLDQQRQEAIARKRRQIHDAVRDRWTEYETLDDEDEEDLLGDLHEALERLAGRDDFLDTPIHRQIEHLTELFAAAAASPDAAAPAGGGPPAEAQRAEERGVEGAGHRQDAKPIRWGGPPDDPFILGEVTVVGLGPRPDDSS